MLPDSGWTIHPNELSGDRLFRPHGVVNSLGERRKIRIECGNDDAGVLRMFEMESNEVAPIQGHNRTAVAHGELQHLGVRHSSAGVTAFLHREDIVPEAPEFGDDGRRHVLVGVEARHDSRRFVRVDQCVDFGCVELRVRPGIHEVFCAKRGIGIEKIRFGDAQPARSHEEPGWDSGAGNAGFSAAHARRGIDAGYGAPQLACHGLQKPCFLAWTQFRQRPLNLFEGSGRHGLV